MKRLLILLAWSFVPADAAPKTPADTPYYELRAGCPSDLNNEFVSIDPPAVPSNTWRKVVVVWMTRKPQTDFWACDVITDTTTEKSVRVLTLQCEGTVEHTNDKRKQVIATLTISKLAAHSVSVKFVHSEMPSSEVHESRMVDNSTRPFIKPLKEYSK